MDRRTFLKTVPAMALLVGETADLANAQQAAPAAAAGVAGDLQPVALLKPQADGGKSVLAALWDRKTNRLLSDKALEPQMLSNLLWAAWGVNRQSGPFGQIGRTAASASNSQEIDLYLALPEGVYLYDAAGHRLHPVAAGDHRGEASRRRRGTSGQTPAVLIFVADIARYAKARLQEPGLKDDEIQKSYANIAVGLIAGNVYLFAASQGLGAWFHTCNKPALAKTLGLRPDQRVLYAQTVGYPA